MDKKFLETYPLYKKFELEALSVHTILRDTPRPAIHMHCGNCESEQTFNMSNQYNETDYDIDDYINDKVLRLKYVCTACNRNTIQFFVYSYKRIEERVDEQTGKTDKYNILYVEKVGQVPAWSIEMDKNLEKELADHATLYKRGLENESQGYGIGAFAYFRRITETTIDQMLDSIPDLLEGEDKTKYEEALMKTKNTRVTQEKIDLVKDLLPSSLRPDGMNPLGVLHSALSEGLHAETDDECMEYADEIKQTLVYLVNQIERSKSTSKVFTASMRKILDKRSDKKIETTEK